MFSLSPKRRDCEIFLEVFLLCSMMRVGLGLHGLGSLQLLLCVVVQSYKLLDFGFFLSQ